MAPGITTSTSTVSTDARSNLVRRRPGHEQAVAIGDTLWNEELARIVQVTMLDQTSAWALFKRYRDKEFGFTDRTSFIVMQRLGLIYAFAFDDDFSQVGRFICVPG